MLGMFGTLVCVSVCVCTVCVCVCVKDVVRAVIPEPCPSKEMPRVPSLVVSRKQPVRRFVLFSWKSD